MRIAQVAPLYEAVPPGAYGGTERVVATLCDELVAMGHDVTLFAPRTSATAAVLEEFGDPLRERMSREQLVTLAPHLHLEMLAELYRRRDDFDVIHSHLDIWTLPYTRLFQTPTVLTMHGRLDLDFLRDLLPRYGSVPLVSISNDQRRSVADLDLTWAATVYNGLDFSAYLDVPHDPEGYLAFVGRIAEEKGPLSAIEVARRCGCPSAWRRRSTHWTSTTTSRRSPRGWDRTSTSSARSRSRRSPPSTAAHEPRCSRATGPSPSGW